MNAMKTLAACALSAMALGTLSISAQAQPLYRSVGADGKVTFSDQPPAALPGNKAAPTKGSSAGSNNASSTASGAGLPAEVRAVASKYPVTLYTGKNCAPCVTARNMLGARGVPFTEKTVDSNEDISAMGGIFAETLLPSATIGGQQLKGYSDLEWTQYLDAAGYPKSSTLPASYRNAAATPMVVKVAPAATTERAAPPAPAAAPVAAPGNAVTPANPAGIKF